MKNLFKYFICLFCFTLFLVAGAFSIETNAGLAVEQDQAPRIAGTPIVEGVCITQDGYEFSMDDVEVVKNGAITEYYLYVNTAITITRTTSDYTVIVSQQNTEGFTTKTTEINSTQKYHCVEYNNTEDKIKLIIELRNTAVTPNVTVTKTEIYVIQTPNHFLVNPSYSWTDSAGTPITAPTTAGNYNEFVQLNNLTGTKLCPVYVDFYFNGEFYSIFTDNDEGIFYNTLTGNKLINTQLKFDIAGQYEIYIYDKTAYKMLKTVNLWNKDYNVFDFLDKSGSPYANAQSYTFNVSTVVRVSDYTGPNDPAYLKALADNIYIVAKDDQGTTIVSTQTLNRTVNIRFFNLDSRVVGKVEIRKFHQTIEGFNEPSIEVLTDKYSISQINNQTFVYSDDNSYAIYIYDRDGFQIGTQNSSTEEDSNFSFTILKDIHSYYKLLDNKDTTLVPLSNRIYSIPQTELLDTNFNSFKERTVAGGEDYLRSSTTTHYSVLLARASTSIEGINNGDKKNSAVDVTVHGVGNISVTVTRDGSTSSYNLKDGDKVPNTSEVGSYTIKVVDQMGFSTTKTFKITKSIDSATIILIVVGALILVILIIVIIRMRTRIKVK